MAATLFFRVGLVLVGLTATLMHPPVSAQTAPTTAAPIVAAPMVAAPVRQQPVINAVAVSGETADESEYRIGSQDLLDITVYGQPELTRTVRVNARGKISLPMVGQLDSVGLTALQLERLIADRLSENLLQNPQITVFVKESISSRFTVEGAVGRPGVFPIQNQLTLLRAIALAGGQGSMADLSNIKLFRTKSTGERETLSFDIEKIRTGELPDPLIVNDDLIVVNRSKVRAAIRDSIFGDIMGIFNPFGALLK